MLQLSSTDKTMNAEQRVYFESVMEAVQQSLELISITEDIYNEKNAFVASPIGKHLRHIIDHFWAYRKGVQCGELDYSERHRDTEIERDPELARSALHNLIAWFEANPPQMQGLRVKTEIALSKLASTTVESNQYRELAFLIGHTYHHLAYASLLAKTLGKRTPDHIGVAPATATFLRENASQPAADLSDIKRDTMG